MNLATEVRQLILDAPARGELVLLLALLDLGGVDRVDNVIGHALRCQFLRDDNYDLETIADYLPQTKSALKRGDYLVLTHQGRYRLRNLCELAFAMCKRLKKFSSAAYVLAVRYRKESDLQPFTEKTSMAPSVKSSLYDEQRDHHVYVILLHSDVLNGYRGQMINPDARRDMPCLYVGLTGFSPEERFRHHKSGRLPSREVQNHGLCLIPNLYAHLKPLPADRGEEAEKALALYLREQGFAVLAGHHDYELTEDNKG
jgi:hypothetical protein